MKTLDENGFELLVGVNGMEDVVININPPPRDMKCDCCGRHISELKPFDISGDGEDVLLLKGFGASWLCRDCIVLDVYGSFERVLGRRKPAERCDCCGKNLGEVKPFDERDPVESHFKGKLLARRHRPDALPTEGVDKMLDEFFGSSITYEDHQKAKEKLIQKCGEEEAEDLWTRAFIVQDLFKHSWECRDCIALDTHQYFERKMAKGPHSGHDSPG